jgi:putative transposase
VSNGVGPVLTIGYRRPTYSQLATNARIALLSIKKAIQLNDEQYWLRLVLNEQSPSRRAVFTYTIPITRGFLTELTERYDVADAIFPVDNAAGLIGGLRRENLSYRVRQHGFRNSVEHIF